MQILCRETESMFGVLVQLIFRLVSLFTFLKKNRGNFYVTKWRLLHKNRCIQQTMAQINAKRVACHYACGKIERKG